MSGMTIGVLHPGSMGVTVASAAALTGHDVVWASEGRSEATLGRAKQAGLKDVRSCERLVGESEAVLSVCPPDSALAVAKEVMGLGFRGTYVDANAVAPETARRICGTVEDEGASFVDGGIIGPPALRKGTTRLYLSGRRAPDIAALFEGSMLGTAVVSALPGAASALKMCYAAYTKGTAALAIAIRALATAEDVEAALLDEWEISQPELKQRFEHTTRNVAPRAWRFVGEMQEIVDTFEAQGLPGEFHRGAARVYEALAVFKDSPDMPSLESIIETLLSKRGRRSTISGAST